MTTPTQTRPSAEDSPRSTLLKLIRGFRVSQMISVAAKLRIADHLAEGPKTVTQLARAAGCHEDSLYRLLRALASIGVFAELDALSFCLSPCAELLQSEVSGSLRTNAEVVGEEWMWLPWGSLLHSVRTGESACELVYGKNTWDWFTENPSAGQLFDQFMDESTIGSAASGVAAYDFLAPRTVIDIAGGRGVLLASILRRNLAARGVLFNLPQVIEAAGKILDSEIASRIQFVPGNFFEGVPAGGDLYILKDILHDWNDVAAQRILGSCRRAMSDNAKLLIIEQLVGAPNEQCEGKIGDISMMVRTGGRNRTELEFRKLLGASGFHLSRLIPTPGGPDIVEALPCN